MDIFNYSFNGIPLFTYGMIGITTIVLATLTMYDSRGSTDESILSKLPSLNTTEQPISSLNPLQTIQSNIPNFNRGGKNITKKNKLKSKNNKTKNNNSKNKK